MTNHPSTQTLEFLHRYLDSCYHYTTGLGSCYNDPDRVEGGPYITTGVCVPCMIDRYLKTKKIPGPDADPWTDIRRGPGFGPHGSGDDGTPFPACHICGGLKPGSGAEHQFIASAVGHQKGCPYGR